MVMGVGVENVAGVYFARKGYYKGKEVTVTHRDPATGDLWLEDYQVKGANGLDYGIWVNADSVSFSGNTSETIKPKQQKKATQKQRRNSKPKVKK